MKDIVFINENNKYKVPFFVRFRINNNNFKFLYDDKLYDKEIDGKYNVKQISLLTEALNIKDKNKRLKFIYEKSCDLLDAKFIKNNLCEFKNNKCIHDRKSKYDFSCNGCCTSYNDKYRCEFFDNGKCKTKCIACKFHTCKYIRKKGYNFRANDILMIKYLCNLKQKIILYNSFFTSKEEILMDLNKSFLKWVFKKQKKFIKK